MLRRYLLFKGFKIELGNEINPLVYKLTNVRDFLGSTFVVQSLFCTVKNHAKSGKRKTRNPEESRPQLKIIYQDSKKA